MPVRATRQIPRNKKTRDSGATIRIGPEGALSGDARMHCFWLTLDEAVRIRAELDVAIAKARAAAPSPNAA